MKFQKNTRRRAKEYESDLISYWKQHKTFEKSVQQRSADNSYVFYDGPPFLTGSPHHGHLLGSTVKDAVARYWTMQGKRVERVWGWDCHGLPAEVYTEKKLGIQDKREIGTKISLEDYIIATRDNMVQTSNLWEDTVNRIGRWVDMEKAYKTMDKDYMESVWWAFKTLYDKGKIYEGEKVLLYCTHDATPLAKAEIAMDNSYKDVIDPSVYVRFQSSEVDADLLVWTTTPWTLSANTALAVGENIEYAEVAIGNDHFILAKSRLEDSLRDDKNKPVAYEILRTFKGDELEGRSYKPLSISINDAKNTTEYKIYSADFVNEEGGTGIVHIAPAYGEDDYLLYKNHQDIAFKMTTNSEGEYVDGPWQGKLVWDVNKDIAKQLYADGVAWRINYIKHSYPHCYRCDTKLMYRAIPSWFIDIADQKELMLAKNTEQINWFPPYLKEGRFAKTIETAPDWNISRDRFWATAMPVWKGVDAQGQEHIKVVGSYEELKELSGVELKDYHRPWVDDVRFTIDGTEYQRIPQVIDCWFESGSMSFAQFHYPFENKEKFEASFPGDFIVEYVGQVRAWFYYMHSVSIALFGESSFKNVITTGTLAGNDGRKMSKSYNNYTDPNELMDQYSADSLRFLMLSSPLLGGEDFALHDKDVGDVARKLSMIWNMYDFFTLYADVDGWEWSGELADPIDSLSSSLDRWVVGRVHQLGQEVSEQMGKYDLQSALKPILPFIDDASNWYVRRSRKRFWKSDNDSDKDDAYRTLHYVLVYLSRVIAPFTPFLAEELYQKLTGGESVHLLGWPEVGVIDKMLITDMNRTRDYITEGLALRAKASIKVRQPLQNATVPPVPKEYIEIIEEELNVKEVNHQDDSTVSINTNITPELKREGMAREVVRQVQNTRKQTGLEVDDRIILSLASPNTELQQAIDDHKDTILAETLAIRLQNDLGGVVNSVNVDGTELDIVIEKNNFKPK